MLDKKGYVYAEASVLFKRMFFAGIVAITLWYTLCAEIKCRQIGVLLPWYGVIPVMLVCMCVPVCNVLLGKTDYQVTCLKETVQVHKLSIFLSEYNELGMEGSIKWLVKACDKYYSALSGVLLYLATGRDALWENVADKCGQPAGTGLLKVMWSRIFEHIKELDIHQNTCKNDVYKKQYEYADKVCDGQIRRLWGRRIFICKIIAYLPVFAAILFYMIYPFVLEGVKLLNTYSEEMKSLGIN